MRSRSVRADFLPSFGGRPSSLTSPFQIVAAKQAEVRKECILRTETLVIVSKNLAKEYTQLESHHTAKLLNSAK